MKTSPLSKYSKEQLNSMIHNTESEISKFCKEARTMDKSSIEYRLLMIDLDKKKDYVVKLIDQFLAK